MRFFILCPACTVTGGPELLHQFSAALTTVGIENYMVYYREYGPGGPIPERFRKYNVKYVTGYVDAPDSILVLPEVRIHDLEMCKKGKAMVWWLSVDNYITVYRNYIKNGQLDVLHLKGRENVIHFVQSFYAKQFLQYALGIEESYFLTDYINDEIIATAQEKRNAYERQNICLYNPKKGYENLELLIQNCRPDIQWVPLKGFTPAQMADIMCKAKVYIDFGAHPGKDRIPREAAICGCCIMTNKLGSALFAQDVTIPDAYKIQNMEDVDAGLSALYDLMDHYEERTEEYEEYRLKIAGEKDRFQCEVQEAIAILQGKTDTPDRMLHQLSEQENAVFDLLEDTIQELQYLVRNAKDLAEVGDGSGAIGELLNADYMVMACREAINAQVRTVAEYVESIEK